MGERRRCDIDWIHVVLIAGALVICGAVVAMSFWRNMPEDQRDHEIRMKEVGDGE